MSGSKDKNFLDLTLDATLGNILGVLTPQKYRPPIKISGKTGEITVVEVFKSSSAEQSGIRVGDVIIDVNGQPILTEQDKRASPSTPRQDSGSLEARALRLLEVGPPSFSRLFSMAPGEQCHKATTSVFSPALLSLSSSAVCAR